MNRLNLLYIIVLIFTLSSCGDSEETVGQLPPNVSVYVTKSSEVPIYKEYVGETLGYQDIDIVARVPGYLEEIHFEEGSEVKQGVLLYTIESQQYEANVAEKKSKLAEQQTLLANAESDLGRYEPLVKENAISEIEYDSAKSRYDAAISSVEAAQANLEAAEIELSYTIINSPLNGIIGKTKAKVGDYVGGGPVDAVLNTVSSVDPILVQFFITETEYLYFARKLGKFEENKKDRENRPNLHLILADESTYEYTGKADFIDRNVDTTTGAILIQASFPNPNELLRPGQFAKIRVAVESIKDGILVPQRSVSELQGIFSVYVVGENNKVENRRVETGSTVGSFWLINSGLKPGEKVIYEGLQFVKEGAIVKPTVIEIPLPDQKEN
ncbi:MAG: efflux RND transporter periplasmic adaptor subunit [Thermodesulfobacteriota bacterium]